MKKLFAGVFIMLLSATLYGENVTIFLSMLPSTNVVESVRVSYGSQLHIYTNSVILSSEYVNVNWITNAPFTGKNFYSCADEYLSHYWKLTITNLVAGQKFGIKVENIFRGGGPVNVYETYCLHTIPTSGTNRYIIPVSHLETL